MKQLPHGYTNSTILDGNGLVLKRYEGEDAERRRDVEATCLGALGECLPVPRVVRVLPDGLLLERLAGQHGQELIEQGLASDVLFAAGCLLRRLHDLSPAAVPGLMGRDGVIVHGDFGPQNLLLSERADAVTAVLDWEWAHVGDPVEDLAWAEWIVRMHHPEQVDSLSRLFEGYGFRPDWADRQRLMVRRCDELGRCDPIDRGGRPTGELWGERRAVAREWGPLSDD